MEEKTREETVEEELQAVIDQRGPEAWNHIIVELLKEISVSLAMLVDASASAE